MAQSTKATGFKFTPGTPTITAATPGQGTTTGNTPVTLTGTNYVATTLKVQFGGTHSPDASR